MYGTCSKESCVFVYLISHFSLYMSIVVLKRNSRRYKARVSGVGSQGFSLNGGHRNQGGVGTTNLARSVTRTPFRGAEPMGHGGCCGSYIRNISNSGSCCVNDSGIVKLSNKNTKGLLLSNQNPTNCNSESSCPTNWVQDTSPLNFSQGTHIKNVQGKTARCDTEDLSVAANAGISNCDTNCVAASYYIGSKKYVRMPYSKRVPQAMSSSEQMRTSLLKKNCLPTPANKQPFPMTLNRGNGGCYENFLTPEQARDAGQLPANWVGF